MTTPPNDVKMVISAQKAGRNPYAFGSVLIILLTISIYRRQKNYSVELQTDHRNQLFLHKD